jgi:hypothetical protein
MSLPGAELRGILSVASFEGKLVREEIYYTVWFNTKFLKRCVISAAASCGVLNQAFE